MLLGAACGPAPPAAPACACRAALPSATCFGMLTALLRAAVAGAALMPLGVATLLTPSAGVAAGDGC